MVFLIIAYYPDLFWSVPYFYLAAYAAHSYMSALGAHLGYVEPLPAQWVVHFRRPEGVPGSTSAPNTEQHPYNRK